MSNIIAIIGPSGVGKTTLQTYLKNNLKIMPLICATTRAKRDDDSADIICVSNEQFDCLKNNNMFLFFSGDYNKYGYFHPNNKDDNASVSFATSYRDLNDILKIKNYNIFTIALAFSNIEESVKRRLEMRNKNMSKDEVEMRISFAKDDYLKNFGNVKLNSDLLIYTDQYNIDEMCSFAGDKIAESLDKPKQLHFRRK